MKVDVFNSARVFHVIIYASKNALSVEPNSVTCCIAIDKVSFEIRLKNHSFINTFFVDSFFCLATV